MGCVVIQILWLTQGGNCMANKEYKSDVFSMLLQDKKRAMEIYNAINGTDYDDPELVEMTTLDDKSFSLTVRNDASFILDANLSLYEHQSTYCPNMPLRDLLYFASIIQKRIKAQKRDIYGGRILKIPVPHFVVFYNGKEDAPDQYDLRLSDAFEKETEDPEIELVCHVYNINSRKIPHCCQNARHCVNICILWIWCGKIMKSVEIWKMPLRKLSTSVWKKMCLGIFWLNTGRR